MLHNNNDAGAYITARLEPGSNLAFLMLQKLRKLKQMLEQRNLT